MFTFHVYELEIYIIYNQQIDKYNVLNSTATPVHNPSDARKQTHTRAHI